MPAHARLRAQFSLSRLEHPINKQSINFVAGDAHQTCGRERTAIAYWLSRSGTHKWQMVCKFENRPARKRNVKLNRHANMIIGVISLSRLAPGPSRCCKMRRCAKPSACREMETPLCTCSGPALRLQRTSRLRYSAFTRVLSSELWSRAFSWRTSIDIV